MFTKPPLHTKVRLTVSNAVVKAFSCKWQPDSVVIEGTVYYSNPWDDADTVRLLAKGHTIMHPVIPLRDILNIEVIGQEYNSRRSEQTINEDRQDFTSKEQVFMIKNSKGDGFYKVTKYASHWQCYCMAGLNGKKCRHLVEAQKQNLEAVKVPG